MDEMIQASIDVVIDPYPEGGSFRVKFPNGEWDLLSVDELENYSLPVPGPVWSLGWVDADGKPVLQDLYREDVEGLADCIDELASIGEFVDSGFRNINNPARMLAKALRSSVGDICE